MSDSGHSFNFKMSIRKSLLFNILTNIDVIYAQNFGSLPGAGGLPPGLGNLPKLNLQDHQFQQNGINNDFKPGPLGGPSGPGVGLGVGGGGGGNFVQQQPGLGQHNQIFQQQQQVQQQQQLNLGGGPIDPNDPCAHLQPNSVNVGESCWRHLWKLAGCIVENCPRFEEWHAAQSLQILLEDVKQWATLQTPKHRQACYGDANYGGPGGAVQGSESVTQPQKGLKPVSLQSGGGKTYVKHMSSQQEFQQILADADKQGIPLVLNFGSESCGFCVLMAPVYELLAEKFSTTHKYRTIEDKKRLLKKPLFLTIDIQQLPEAANFFEIQGLPAFRTVFDGQITGQIDGADTVGLDAAVDRCSMMARIDEDGEKQLSEGSNTDLNGQVQQLNQLQGQPVQLQVTELSDEDLVTKYRSVQKELRRRARKQIHQHMREGGSIPDTDYDLKAALYADIKTVTAQHNLSQPLSQSLPQTQSTSDKICQHLPSYSYNSLSTSQNKSQSQSFNDINHSLIIEKIVIIGGGPAGLAAALYAARAGLCPIVISPHAGGQLLAKGVDVENYPGMDKSTGNAIIGDMRAQVLGFEGRLVAGWAGEIRKNKNDDIATAITYDVKIKLERFGSSMTSEFQQSNSKFAAGNTTSYDLTLKTRTVVYAAGAEARWLNVRGEEELKGKGISACSACDGYVYRGKTCAVIGGGDSAIESVLFLSKNICKTPVLMFHRKGTFDKASSALRHKLEKLERESESNSDGGTAQPYVKIFRYAKIEEFESSVSESESESDSNSDSVSGSKLKAILVSNTTTDEHDDGAGGETVHENQYKGSLQRYAVDAVFVNIGHIPSLDALPKEIDVEKIRASNNKLGGNSNKDLDNQGFYLAGDVVDTVYRQAITAASSGAMAAIDAERYLSE